MAVDPRQTLDRVSVIHWGLIFLTVCADAEVEQDEIEAQANMLHPTGISSRWEVGDNTHFDSGQENPCACNLKEGRQHWLLSC